MTKTTERKTNEQNDKFRKKAKKQSSKTNDLKV